MKKIFIYSLMFIATTTFGACSSEIKDGTTDIDSWPDPVEEFDVKLSHPCMLHTAADFKRVKEKVNANAQPWTDGWNILIANDKAQETYTANPVAKLIRGGGSKEEPEADNYSKAMYDVAAAYQLGLRWKISGDDKYADAAVKILNAWATTCKSINGDSNKYLAAGIYGYQFANAAEILRDYSGWAAADFNAYKTWLSDLFYPLNKDFLERHNGTCISHYWTNWDVCNMASGLAIGILCDDKEKINYNLNYFKKGAGNGGINQAVTSLHTLNGQVLGQGQESGRDQGHATLVISLYGAFCQMAYNIGVDFFAYDNNKLLALCEYTAMYNVDTTIADTDMPFTKYTNCEGETHTIISNVGRGTLRPAWELIYNHYAKVKKISAPWSQKFAEKVRPEGGGGNYGPNSGGYDQMGFGTLMYTQE
ncbi:alginate lyase family protein [Dysgonomonas sp. GY75]|uniref:alginate lyase family protein n=1 Tax=Dysgonomonas sp. GY75 TaxID=2780419 RepID=UPI001884867D|nr:alginate lyase family protein [Dysgonomonas sp. GY75]MBF0650140.1 alginate lyase family protein [Dysgonomonas sp. GY75]